MIPSSGCSLRSEVEWFMTFKASEKRQSVLIEESSINAGILLPEIEQSGI